MLSSIAPAAMQLLVINHPHLLYAKTFALAEMLGFLVYKSPLVRETDSIYAPIAVMLDGPRKGELIYRTTVDDQDMMLNEGELSVYVHQRPESQNGQSDEKLIKIAKEPRMTELTGRELAEKLLGPRWEEIENYAANNSLTYAEAVVVMVNRGLSHTDPEDLE